MASDPLRRLANLVFAAGQAALPAVLFQGDGFDADSAAGNTPNPPTPAEPEGYAFAIWGLIYAASLAYAVHQALPAQARDPLLRRIGWATAAGFALNCAWLFAAEHGPVSATVPIIVAMLACIGYAFVVAARAPGSVGWRRNLLVTAPLAVYAAWLSVAAFVNMAEIANDFYGRLGLSVSALSVLALTAGSALALAVLVAVRGSLAYALTILWALAAVVAANTEAGLGSPTLLTALVGSALVALATATLHLHRARAA